jgi:L-alanine-DL-glutamate epimerase-like enolase superfamily enzyme
LEARLPVRAIVGYPPTLDGPAVARQARELYAAGWRRFKLAIAATPELSRERLHAAASAGPDALVAIDAAWTRRDVADAVALLDALEYPALEWYEDVFPPGDARLVSELRQAVDVPIAMGDDQGGAYYPEALLAAGAVDVVRVDATTMGGLSRLLPMLDQIAAAGAGVSPHMFPHVHAEIFGALGLDLAIEWGLPGVHHFDDALPRPVVAGGRMAPLDHELGFGRLVTPAWIREQRVDDPAGVLQRIDADVASGLVR